MPDRPVLCYRCKTEVVSYEKTKRTNSPKVGRRNCLSCSAKLKQERKDILRIRNQGDVLRKLNSNRMREMNPMRPVGSGPKKHLTELEKQFRQQIAKENTRRRMLENNPMHISCIAAKVRETVARKKASGEWTFKRGVAHKSWKGNRLFNEAVRTRLYPVWTFPIMLRDKFACTRCGCTTGLQVHHITPLREYIAKVRENHGIKRFSEVSSDKWEPYIVEVLSLHKTTDGLTVCKDCHSFIDAYYREHRSESKKNIS